MVLYFVPQKSDMTKGGGTCAIVCFPIQPITINHKRLVVPNEEPTQRLNVGKMRVQLLQAADDGEGSHLCHVVRLVGKN